MYNRKIKTSSHLFEDLKLILISDILIILMILLNFFKIKLNNILKNNNLNKLLEII